MDSSFAVLDYTSANDRDLWMEIWTQWHGREVAAHPGYVNLFAVGSDKAMCAVYKSSKGQIMFPFVRRLLKDQEWAPSCASLADIATPYGYSGAFCSGEPDAEAFWDRFDQWALSNGIVSLFARLSLFPEQTIPFRGVVRDVAPSIVRSLDLTPEDVWHDYAHKVRKNVNSAIRNGVTVQIDSSGATLDEFTKIYYSTMDRRSASDFYYFPQRFFTRLVHDLPEAFRVFNAYKAGGQIISTELVLVSEDYLYSFLGGTLEEAFHLRPNDLLKHAIVSWGIEQRKKAYVLGGGFSSRDGIYQYKASFAPHGEVPFRTGHRVFQRDMYDVLVRERGEWEARNGREWDPRPGYFPLYRG